MAETKDKVKDRIDQGAASYYGLSPEQLDLEDIRQFHLCHGCPGCTSND